MLLVALGCFGCGKITNADAKRDEVLRWDPEFAATLDLRDELAARIRVLEHELALKRTQIERRITQQHKELSEAKSQVSEKIEQTAELLNPEREQIELTLALAVEEYREKQQQREHVTREISRLRKALKAGNQQQSAADRLRMDQELAELIADAKRLDQELLVLQRHQQLLETKLDLLRL